MRLRVDGREFEGRAIDLSEADVSASAVVRSIREVGSPSADPPPVDSPSTDSSSADPPAVVSIDCSPPGPVHERVGHVAPGMSFDLRGALAAAARSRGVRAPESSALRAARERLDSLSPPDADPTAARRRVAETGADERRLRERVATARGRLQALREVGDDDEIASAEAELSTAVRRLSEVETERLAAEQRLERLEAQARAARDAREERLALQDRVGNLERAARRSLAAAVWEEFVDAVDDLSHGGVTAERRDGGMTAERRDGGGATDDLAADALADGGPGSYRGDPATGALAVIRIADVAAPVVLSVRRFGSAAAAARRLDAPVVRV